GERAWRGEGGVRVFGRGVWRGGGVPRVMAVGFLATPPFRGNLTGWKALDDRIREMVGTASPRSTCADLVSQWTWAIERLKESPDGLRAHAAEWDARRAAAAAIARLARYVADF